MLQAAINIDSLMRRRRCGKLHGGSSHLLLTGPACNRLLATSYNTTIAICAFHTCIRRPHWGGPCRNIAIKFDTDKLEWFGYPMVKKYSCILYRF